MGQSMVHGKEPSQDKVQGTINDRRHDDNHYNGNDHKLATTTLIIRSEAGV
jgi:hypothetical protein